MLNGRLFIYQKQKKLCAFESGKIDNPQITVILVGGLTDGFLTLPYAHSLSQMIEQKYKGSLVQVLLSSSYSSFGLSSLENDAAEINDLILCLESQLNRKYVLIGHSTGCQDVLTFLGKKYQTASSILGCILQGGVSDREYFTWSNPNLLKYVDLAKDRIDEGNYNQLMPQDAELMPNCPISAYRFHSLLAIGGDDDLFSSDLDITKQKLHFDTFVPLAVVLCEKDEYIPSHVSVSSLIERYKQFPSVHFTYLLKEADHSITSKKCIDDFLEFFDGCMGHFLELTNQSTTR